METGDITLVGIGVAVIAVLIALYFGLRAETRAFRAELREQVTELREQIAELREQGERLSQRISDAEREQVRLEATNDILSDVLRRQSHTHPPS